MIEKRVYRIEDKELTTRTEKTEKGTEIIGYASLFNQESKPITERINGKIESFIETIEPTAFREAVIEDVIYNIDHDPSKLIARQSAGNLTVQVTEKGLLFRATPPNTTLANDLIENINVGNYQENSFAFRVKQDRWYRDENKVLHRNISAIDRIVDVSTVVNGAYSDTIIATRNLNEKEITVQIEETVEPVQRDIRPEFDDLDLRIELEKRRIF